MHMVAQATEPSAARQKCSYLRIFAALVPECAAHAEFGYEDRQKLTLIVEESRFATVTHRQFGAGDVAAFVTCEVTQAPARWLYERPAAQRDRVVAASQARNAALECDRKAVTSVTGVTK